MIDRNEPGLSIVIPGRFHGKSACAVERNQYLQLFGHQMAMIFDEILKQVLPESCKCPG